MAAEHVPPTMEGLRRMGMVIEPEVIQYHDEWVARWQSPNSGWVAYLNRKAMTRYEEIRAARDAQIAYASIRQELMHTVA